VTGAWRGDAVTRYWQRWSRGVCVVLALAVTILLQLAQPNMATRLDEGMRDTFVRLNASEAPETRMTIVDIDEQSLKEEGVWPWPRAKVADLIEGLFLDYDARKVALDIVFPKPADPDGDARLALLMAHMPLTNAQVLDLAADRSYHLEEGVLSAGQLASSAVQIQSLNTYFAASGFIANHAGFAGTPCTGNVGFMPDPDGVLRRLPTITTYEGRAYLGLAEAMLGCANGSSAKADVKLSGPDYFRQRAWRVPYTHSQTSYMVVSASDVLNKRIPTELFAGRYVLIGSSSISVGDRVSTPLAPLSAGLMVHAAALSGLLDLQEGLVLLPRDGTLIMLVSCCAFFALAVWVVTRRGALSSTAYLLGIALLWVAVSYQLVVRQFEVSIVAPLAGVLVLLITLVPLEWWHSQAQTRSLRNTLGRYVAKPVLDAITRSGDFGVLVPRATSVTVLVVDMADYTRTTSSIGLEELVDLTKDFLGCITKPVLALGGTLDKYTGDGLLAFWGAPLPCDNSADLAIDAALQIIEDFAAFNQLRVEAGTPVLSLRIGIESGEAVVGELGTRFRTTYTAIGECVNHASRIEAAASKFGIALLIGPMAASQSTKHTLKAVGMLPIRGTDEAIHVYTCEQDHHT